MQISFYNDKLKKWPKIAKFYKIAKCVFSWPAHFIYGQIFRNWPWNGQSGNPAAEASCETC